MIWELVQEWVVVTVGLANSKTHKCTSTGMDENYETYK